LAASFHKGRDKWKKKAQDRNKAIKVLKVHVHDLEESRQHHRQRAREAQESQGQLEHQVQQLQAEVEQLRAQRDELRRTLGSKKA
jgi:prefoldin subunit 5